MDLWVNSKVVKESFEMEMEMQERKKMLKISGLNDTEKRDIDNV